MADGAIEATLTVVGGSSPFTLGLAQALAEDPPWAEGTLRLHGRDTAALDVVARCADAQLRPAGWRAEAVADPEAVGAGGGLVLHQNRYGGLAWRERDEQLATELGLAPDETLGPGGLAAALRTSAGQGLWTTRLRRCRVLTTTNPLGVSVACFADAGIDALGLCELPELTRRAIEDVAAGGPMTAAYDGFNHRGFWHHLRTPAGDALDRVVQRLEAGASLPGAGAATVQTLEAVPDKYHVLVRGGRHLQRGRAVALAGVRDRILAEAAADPDRLPPSLAERDMPWQRVVVLPVLHALAGRATRLVLTLPTRDGIARERQVVLTGGTPTAVDQPAPPPAVARWCERFAAHETATMAAVRDPSPVTVRAALDADPTVPAALVARAADAVWADVDEWGRTCASS